MAGGFSLCSGEVKQLSRKRSWGVRGQDCQLSWLCGVHTQIFPLCSSEPHRYLDMDDEIAAVFICF